MRLKLESLSGAKMAKFINPGETIEGNSVGIQTRKWVPSTIVVHPVVKKRMYRYSTNLNSNATVRELRELPADAELAEATKGYHRNLGDELECFGMKVYVDSFKKEKESVDEGVAHTHGAIFVTTEKHTIATISTPLSCLMKVIAQRGETEKDNMLIGNRTK